ncbi:hypothetical protein Droror1_Dr00016334, partial [Drosera rotundifolia]
KKTVENKTEEADNSTQPSGACSIRPLTNMMNSLIKLQNNHLGVICTLAIAVILFIPFCNI